MDASNEKWKINARREKSFVKNIDLKYIEDRIVQNMSLVCLGEQLLKKSRENVALRHSGRSQ